MFGGSGNFNYQRPYVAFSSPRVQYRSKFYNPGQSEAGMEVGDNFLRAFSDMSRFASEQGRNHISEGIEVMRIPEGVEIPFNAQDEGYTAALDRGFSFEALVAACEAKQSLDESLSDFQGNFGEDSFKAFARDVGYYDVQILFPFLESVNELEISEAQRARFEQHIENMNSGAVVNLMESLGLTVPRDDEGAVDYEAARDALKGALSEMIEELTSPFPQADQEKYEQAKRLAQTRCMDPAVNMVGVNSLRLTMHRGQRRIEKITQEVQREAERADKRAAQKRIGQHKAMIKKAEQEKKNLQKTKGR